MIDVAVGLGVAVGAGVGVGLAIGEHNPVSAEHCASRKNAPP